MRPKARRIAFWSIVTLGGLVGIPGAIWLLPYWSAKAELNRAIDACRADGIPASPADLAPPPVPENENAAPLLMGALDNYHEDPLRLRDRRGGYASLTEEERAQVVEWMGVNGEAFAMARAARSRPRCRFDRNYASLEGARDVRGSELLTLALDLAWRAEVERAVGRLEEARECVRDALGIAHALREEPLLPLQQIRLIIVNAVLRRFDRFVTRDTPMEELAGWLDLVPSPDDAAAWMALGARGETALEIAFFLGPIKDVEALYYSQGPYPMDEDGVPTGPPSHNAMRRDMARCIGFSRRLAAIHALPVIERSAAAAALLTEVEALPDEAFRITKSTVPYLCGYVRNHLQMIAKLAVVRNGLDMEVHYALHGVYDDPGLDPMTGRPLLVSNERGVLYSVGDDGVDNGGQAEYPNVLDVVWHLRRMYQP